MTLPKYAAVVVPAFLLTACLSGTFFAQEPDKQPVQIKGEAKVNSHTQKVEKGVAYRITIKTDGSIPSPNLQPIGGNFNMTGLSGGNNENVYLFIPNETREQEFAITFQAFAGFKGALKDKAPYTFTVERASFTPENTVNAKFEISEQKVKLEAGKMYALTVKSTEFVPNVYILQGDQVLSATQNYGYNQPIINGKPSPEQKTTASILAKDTDEYRVLINWHPNPQFNNVIKNDKIPNKDLAYTLDIAEMKTELSVKGILTPMDPIYPMRGQPHKNYAVKLEAGKTYQIDYVRTNPNNGFDPYLYLEDATGKVLMQDDDSGGNLNSRIVFTPTTTDNYRIIATSLGQQGGDFNLTIFVSPGTGAANPPGQRDR